MKTCSGNVMPNLLPLLLLFGLQFLFISSSDAQGKKKLRINGKSFEHQPRTPIPDGQNSDCGDLKYRTIDGTCNNTHRTTHYEWGASDIKLLRTMNSDYGFPDDFNDMAGQTRKSAREISNLLSAQSSATPSQQGLSSFVFTWGQFLDHDISLTPEGHTEYHPIPIPSNEPLFQNDIPFLRSAIHEGSGTNTYREQTNLITSWIDASNVYGSDQERASWLRTFEGGKMKMSSGQFLPYNTTNSELSGEIDPNAPAMAGDGGGTQVTFVAGDIRAVEQPGLTALHTLFIREHNRICEDLYRQGMRQDEEIYQEARKMVGAFIQNITYNEFLPALGIDLRRYRRYDEDARPDISNLFATAAYRLGHTMVTDEILLRDDNCQAVSGGSLTLLEGFFNPEVLPTYGLEAILKGLSIQVQNEVDLLIIDNLRNFLFGDPRDPNTVGLDLASLNIQRGRDHGLPDYNTVREKYLGRSVRRFSDITDNNERRMALEAAYDDVNSIDLWVGLLSEDLESGKSVGPTLEKILETQFKNLRDGDHYYFENERQFDRRERDRIKRTKLSDIIERNTDLNQLSDNVFKASLCGSNMASSREGPGDSFKVDVETSALNIWPNPAVDVLSLSFTEIGTSTIQIIASNGQVVYQEKRNSPDLRPVNLSINVKGLAEGIYFLQVRSDQNLWTEKIVISD